LGQKIKLMVQQSAYPMFYLVMQKKLGSLCILASRVANWGHGTAAAKEKLRARTNH
jgi:hypothetical protein